MAETQEDKTTNVKALYKGPPSKQSNIIFWWYLVLLFLFSSLCQRISPYPRHKYWLLLLPLTACYILLACHVSSPPSRTWDTHFSKDLYEPGPYQTMKSSPVWVWFLRYDSPSVLHRTPTGKFRCNCARPDILSEALSQTCFQSTPRWSLPGLINPPSGLPWTISFFFSHPTTHLTPAKDEFSYSLDFSWQRAQPSSFHSQTPLNWMIYEKNWVFSVSECFRCMQPPLCFTPHLLHPLSALLSFLASSSLHHTTLLPHKDWLICLSSKQSDSFWKNRLNSSEFIFMILGAPPWLLSPESWFWMLETR